eukprot:5267793-Alexandrium_andersonii.AAC.1
MALRHGPVQVMGGDGAPRGRRQAAKQPSMPQTQAGPCESGWGASSCLAIWREVAGEDVGGLLGGVGPVLGGIAGG